MTRRFANTQTTNTISSSGSGINNNNNNSNNDNASEPISVIKLAKSGGCVDRDETYMRQLRHAQIRTYFFGDGSGSAAGGGAGGTGAVGMNGTLLNPHTQVLDYQVLKIFRVASGEFWFFAFCLDCVFGCCQATWHFHFHFMFIHKRRNSDAENDILSCVTVQGSKSPIYTILYAEPIPSKPLIVNC